MHGRRLVLVALAVALALPLPAAAAERIRAVATFSILADMVRQVGGDRVDVVALVGPGGDTHVYQPTPADARTLKEAKLLVINGLGLEGWIPRLGQSSGFTGVTVTAAGSVKPREVKEEAGHGHRHGPAGKAFDPHAWQDLGNGRLYVQAIRDGLIQADPDGRPAYEANAARYSAEIETVDREVRAAIGKIPPVRRRIITSHDALNYFGAAYGVEIIAPTGVSTDSEASARDVARIIRQIKADKIPAVFVETITDRRLLEQIVRETGARIGGTLFTDALSQPGGPAPTYFDMFRSNIRVLTAALTPEG